MKLVVDSVLFEDRPGLTRIWSSILSRLAGYPDLTIVLLDRGDGPVIDGIERLDFPPYDERYSAAESIIIDHICREVRADVFASTFYTTPLCTPSVVIVYDMIPEAMGFALSKRRWQEKRLSIGFSSYCACLSETTRTDLLRIYPGIAAERVFVTYCGVDRAVFYPRESRQIEDFRRTHDIAKPYVLLVGPRAEHKNGELAFRALGGKGETDVEVVCVGGETSVELDSVTSAPLVRRVELSDTELAAAYSGAEALLHPSLYEGFGLPIAEAMACGCPVITTQCGALGEVAGDAAMFISGHDEKELRSALAAIRRPEHRREHVERGLRRAARFDWDDMVSEFHRLLASAVDERTDPRMQTFFREWTRLRTIQARVDT
jgi:glycosyltransferase involved in cell wall biosynthesis